MAVPEIKKNNQNTQQSTQCGQMKERSPSMEPKTYSKFKIGEFT